MILRERVSELLKFYRTTNMNKVSYKKVKDYCERITFLYNYQHVLEAISEIEKSNNFNSAHDMYSKPVSPISNITCFSCKKGEMKNGKCSNPKCVMYDGGSNAA